jgi:hypothetical protein
VGLFLRSANLNPNTDDLSTAYLPGVEIFAEGNGDTYEAKGLQELIDRFGNVGLEPTVKAGHVDGQDAETRSRKVFGSLVLRDLLPNDQPNFAIFLYFAFFPRFSSLHLPNIDGPEFRSKIFWPKKNRLSIPRRIIRAAQQDPLK